MRTPHGEFDGYHTSADGLDRILPESLSEAVSACLAIIDVLETNRRCTNLSPNGEPQFGRRGLYRSAGGAVATPDDERALLWVLNQSEGIRVCSRSRVARIELCRDREGRRAARASRAARREPGAGVRPARARRRS